MIRSFKLVMLALAIALLIFGDVYAQRGRGSGGGSSRGGSFGGARGGGPSISRGGGSSFSRGSSGFSRGGSSSISRGGSSSFRAPSVNRSAPSISRSAPSINRSAPSIGRGGPSISRSAPSISRSAPSISRSAPSIGRSSPNINRSSPSIGRSSPRINSSAPGINRNTPSLRSSGPRIGSNSSRSQIGNSSGSSRGNLQSSTQGLSRSSNFSRNSTGRPDLSLGQRQIGRSSQGSLQNRISGRSPSNTSTNSLRSLRDRGGQISLANNSISSRNFSGLRSGSFSNLSSSLNRGGNWGGYNWSSRYYNRHHNWYRGFSVNLFLGSPWSWSPWWGGNYRYGYGGWGINWRGWGWGDWWSPWGYAPLAFRTGYWNYYNPYCYEPLVLGSTVINYSEPIIISSNDVADPASDDSAAMAHFDAARAAFGQGDYESALQSTHHALEYLPTDAALNEFLSLVHFARGNYRDAAGVIHSVLAAGPGWNWETLLELYGRDVNTYTQHLRAAEAYRAANPDAADVRFLLAYHYTTNGYGDAAAKQLRRVLELEPNDTVAAQLLEGLTGERVTPPPATGPSLVDPASTSTASIPDPPPLPVSGDREALKPGTTPTAGALVGSWSASREDGGKFSLELTTDNRFDWTFSHKDQKSDLKGQYSLNGELLVLEPEDGGAMIGRVEVTGDNQFRFRLVGAPEDDPGISFGR